MSGQEKYKVAQLEMVNGVASPMSSKKIFDAMDYYGAIGLKTTRCSTVPTTEFGTISV